MDGLLVETWLETHLSSSIFYFKGALLFELIYKLFPNFTISQQPDKRWHCLLGSEFRIMFLSLEKLSLKFPVDTVGYSKCQGFRFLVRRNCV